LPFITRSVRHGEHVGVRRAHVEPRREPREAGAFRRDAIDRGDRDQLGSLRSAQVRERHHEVLDASLLRDLG
jgi:hypothetical protein